MRKKTAKNLSGIKGRSKIPNDLYRWMMRIEAKNPDIAKVDIEYAEPTTGHDSHNGTLRVIYYTTTDNGQWKILDVGQVTPFSLEQADDFFESKALSKADFLIKLIDDQSKMKSMLDNIYNEDEVTKIDPKTDKKIRAIFSDVQKRIDPDSHENIDFNDNVYSQQFRKKEYFSNRPGEEDDDFPDLNQHDRNTIRDIITAELKSSNIPFKRLRIAPSEKSWFSVEIHL